MCVFDLRALSVQGSPALTNRVSGRAMDWTTSEEVLKIINDDNVVLDEPAKVTQIIHTYEYAVFFVHLVHILFILAHHRYDSSHDVSTCSHDMCACSS
jgi:hypothetical protein